MSYAFGGFLLLIFSGMPIVFALGVSALLAIVLMTDAPLVIVAQRVYGGINSFQLLAIPFFVVAGIIMAAGGFARRFVDTIGRAPCRSRVCQYVLFYVVAVQFIKTHFNFIYFFFIPSSLF